MTLGIIYNAAVQWDDLHKPNGWAKNVVLQREAKGGKEADYEHNLLVDTSEWTRFSYEPHTVSHKALERGVST